MLACEADDCTHRFCTYCLAVHLGIDTEAASSSSFKGTPWHCPTCSSKCCCSQPECTKAHRHCKAHRYRCRRAAAANLRMSAAHALVSLGGSLPAGKGKNKLAQQASAGAHGALENENKQTAQRPAKRRAPSPAGPQEGGDETAAVGGTWEDHDGVSKARLLGEARIEVEAGEAAVGVLALSLRAEKKAKTADAEHSMDTSGVLQEAQDGASAPAAFAAASSPRNNSLAGKVLCFSGTLTTKRKQAATMAEAAGAKVFGSVTRQTTHLVVGSGAGDKVARATAKGLTIWTEDDFLVSIGGGSPAVSYRACAAPGLVYDDVTLCMLMWHYV